MADINNEAANTRKMREHQSKKLIQYSVASYEETDLIMCSNVVSLGSSVALNRNVHFADLVSVMVANPENLALVSDVDNQLILKVQFKDPVTVTSVAFRAETPPSTPESVPEFDPTNCSGPKRIRCFANTEDLDFVDTESISPAQVIELSPAQLSGTRVPLRGNRFSRCQSIQFFIEDNQGATDFTFLNRLCLWGRVSAAYHTDF